MTLKDIRDGLSRMFAKDRALEFTDVNHVLIEDVNGVHHFDYLLKDDSETEEDEEDDEDAAICSRYWRLCVDIPD